MYLENAENVLAQYAAASPASTPRFDNAQTIAMQALCKQLLKSRLFRGFYEVRYYVSEIQSYRDVVSLHRSERELKKLLQDVSFRLQQYFEAEQQRQIWIGVSMGAVSGVTPQPQAIDTFVWSELDDLAFGEYWFSIRTVRFRNNEVILKLKAVRPVELQLEAEASIHDSIRRRNSTNSTIEGSDRQRTTTTTVEEPTGAETEANDNASLPPNASSMPPRFMNTSRSTDPTIEDFIEVLCELFNSVKRACYEFLANDINRDNIGALVRFLCLVAIGLLSGSMAAIKHLGIFIIHLMAEVSRLTNALTPIMLTVLQMISRMIGALFYILAMMWKDTFGGIRQPTAPSARKKHLPPSIAYNRFQSNRDESSTLPYSNIDPNIPRHRLHDRRNPFVIH